MTRLRRRPRAIYRVYGEEEYLAGADALPAREDAPPAEEPTHGRRLQRIAGAAALTGAVGTVGGVVGLAGLRTHARALDRREIAQRTAPPLRAAGSRGHASPSSHLTRREILHRYPSRHAHARRARAERVSQRPASRVGAGARTMVVASASRETFARAASAPPSASTETASATRGAPAETPSAAGETRPGATAARPAAQSEFGFER
jgi:hypothetical protein